MLRIFHSCIDVHKDFDSCTNGVVSIYPSASTLLHKDVANFDGLCMVNTFSSYVDSLCMVDTFSSHVGLSRVFYSHFLAHNKPLLSTLLLHIKTPHDIMKSSCLLVENSWYLFMHNAYCNCNHFFVIMFEMYVILKAYGKFRRLVFDPGGLVIFHLLISSIFSYFTFLITMFCFCRFEDESFLKREGTM